MTTDHADRHIGLADAPDDVLVDRATDGDARAFGVLVTRYGRLLQNYAVHVLGSATGSDDVVQEALVSAWQQLDDLHDRSAVRAWLIRIVTRKALSLVRGTRVHDDVDDLELAAPAAIGPEVQAEAGSLSAALAAALDRLPELQRRSWTLRELGGFSYDEIAAELGVPVSTVRGALARARATLISDLDGWR
ncbi:MAG: RNA polymerase sigma factor [Acidobacteria bacterium]|nr:RNA polymerase sigma factor [Acidobacteriota bacterium]